MSVNIAVLGAQWGDEGKGKIVDLLSPNFSIVARYQGGHNAGHTIWVNGKKFVLKLIPSGILHPGVICVLGNGMVIDPDALFNEVMLLADNGVDVTDRILISDRAHVILPYHRDLDLLEEQRREKKIGTTKRGIGPCYEDKIARRGIRICDLKNLSEGNEAFTRLFENIVRHNAQYGESGMDPSAMAKSLREAAQWMRPFVRDTSKYLYEAIAADKSIMFEGAQGTLLDIDHGTYPYVTSSNATAGGVANGLGIGPTSIHGVLGIVKAYATRVGEGPMPTELPNEIGNRMRQKGEEFGAVTGRPRRCGWYDVVAVRYAARVNGLDALGITKLDVLDDFEDLQVCTAYRYEGRTIHEMPADTTELAKCEPILEWMPGWGESTRGITEFENLPSRAQIYIRRLAACSGVPAKIIGNGQDRNDFIVRKDVDVPVLNWMNELSRGT